jgi:hypothetical protein
MGVVYRSAWLGMRGDMEPQAISIMIISARREFHPPMSLIDYWEARAAGADA